MAHGVNCIAYSFILYSYCSIEHIKFSYVKQCAKIVDAWLCITGVTSDPTHPAVFEDLWGHGGSKLWH